MNLLRLSELINSLAGKDSIAELARRMGVKPGTLRTYARNDGGYPSVETLMAIADYMEIELDELVRRVSEPPRCRTASAPYVVSAYHVISHLERLPRAEQTEVARALFERLLAS